MYMKMTFGAKVPLALNCHYLR